MSNFTLNEFIGNELLKARKGLKLSQAEAARKHGVSRTVISQIENGNRKITFDDLVQFTLQYQINFFALIANYIDSDFSLSLPKYEKQKIIISGSNKKGNISKITEAYNVFKSANFDVSISQNILNEFGIERVIKEVIKADILYVVNFNPYINDLTISLLAIAKQNYTDIYMLKQFDSLILQEYSINSISPENLVASLEE